MSHMPCPCGWRGHETKPCKSIVRLATPFATLAKRNPSMLPRAPPPSPPPRTQTQTQPQPQPPASPAVIKVLRRRVEAPRTPDRPEALKVPLPPVPMLWSGHKTTSDDYDDDDEDIDETLFKEVLALIM